MPLLSLNLFITGQSGAQFTFHLVFLFCSSLPPNIVTSVVKANEVDGEGRALEGEWVPDFLMNSKSEFQQHPVVRVVPMRGAGRRKRTWQEAIGGEVTSHYFINFNLQ